MESAASPMVMKTSVRPLTGGKSNFWFGKRVPHAAVIAKPSDDMP